MSEIIFFGKSDAGCKRSNNEDAYVVSPGCNFVLVADGIGGAAAGELASSLFASAAVEVFAGSVRRTEKETLDLVEKAFSLANKRILDHIRENPHHEGMGCTAELLAFTNNLFVIGHVGDSRTYVLRNGQFKQLTHDHSLVQAQVDQGLISREEAKTHRFRNVLSQAVGIGRRLALDILQGKIFPGDLFLLCSDGLTDMVDDSAIAHIISSAGSVEQKVDALIESAKSAGGNDNITLVIAQVFS